MFSIYFISSQFILFLNLCHFFPSGYFRIFQDISGYFNIFQYISIDFKIFQYTTRYFNIFAYIPSCFKLFQDISIHNVFGGEVGRPEANSYYTTSSSIYFISSFILPLPHSVYVSIYFISSPFSLFSIYLNSPPFIIFIHLFHFFPICFIPPFILFLPH